MPGKTISLREGSDVLMISTGPQSVRCLQGGRVARKAQGISAGVLHLPSIKPVNKEEIISASEKAKLVVTVEEHTIYGGLGGLVAEILSEASPRKVVRFGIEDRWGESAPNDYLLDVFQMSPAALERANQNTSPITAMAATSTIGVAFLGVGRMGETHLRNLVGLSGVRVVAVADPNGEAAERGKVAR